MGNLLSSKVIVEEEQPQIRTIDSVQTSVLAAIGVTEMGPLQTPTLVTSFDEYKQRFGGFTANSDLALAVQGFFDNEGQFAYIVRTVHYTDNTNQSTKVSAAGTLNLLTAASGPTAGSVTGSNTETFDLEPGDTVIVDVDAGGAATATFDATAASRTAGNAETYALANGQTLTVSIDGGSVQTITFLTAEFVAIAAATALEVAAVINAKITGAFADVTAGAVRITSDKRGTDSGVNVTGGTANTALSFTTGNVAGTGDVADIDAVTAAEAKTVIEADVAGCTVSSVGGAVKITSNTTGVSSSIQVTASSTADTAFGFDNAVHSGTTGAAENTLKIDGKWDGAYINSYTVLIEAATSGEAEEFNMSLLKDGLTVESWANLSMVDTADRYVENVLNLDDSGETSLLVTVTDLDSGAASQRPANNTYGPFTGGDDGLTGLADTDFIGSEAGATGIRALDTVQDANLLIVPNRCTSAVQNAMINYCESTRSMSMFAILGSPAGLTASAAVTYFQTTASLTGLSEFGAAYWPRLKILNPSETVFGNVETLTVDPVGIIAGVYARTDASRDGGVYDPPAGIEKGILFGAVGFETDEVYDERKRDLVFPKRINILTSYPGAPRHIDGSRTLKSNGNFPFVAQRRGAIFIEQSIKNGSEFARNQNNTPKLRRILERSIYSFLLTQMKNEAFASNDPDLAFFVDLSDKLNTASVVNAGKMIGRIGLAFNTPAEFIILRFSKDTRALDQEISG